MQAIKIFLAVVFSIGAIGGFTSVGGIQDSSSKSQTLLFAVAFALIAIGCILSFKKGREKQAIKAFQKQEEEKAFAEAQRQREERMQKALSMSTLPVEQYPEAIILNAGEICHYQVLNVGGSSPFGRTKVKSPGNLVKSMVPGLFYVF